MVIASISQQRSLGNALGARFAIRGAQTPADGAGGHIYWHFIRCLATTTIYGIYLQ